MPGGGTVYARMPAPRRQLTLFLPAEAAAGVEAVRRVVDPVQWGLIAAHVTLCRDDELGELADPCRLRARLAEAAPAPLHLRFGAIEAFQGHGLLLACTHGQADFTALRERLLGAPTREQPAHVTLAHPRNPRAPGNASGAADALALPLSLVLSQVSLIAQEHGAPWRTLCTVELAPCPTPAA